VVVSRLLTHISRQLRDFELLKNKLDLRKLCKCKKTRELANQAVEKDRKEKKESVKKRDRTFFKFRLKQENKIFR